MRTLRVLGAVALFGVAADHLYEYFVDHYNAIPTIGPLFVLNGIGGIALGLVLLAPVNWVVRRAPRGPALAAIAGIGLAASSLAGLFVSEATPLFGFMEFGYRPVIVLAIVTEAAAILLLGASLLVAARTTTASRGLLALNRRRSTPAERETT